MSRPGSVKTTVVTADTTLKSTSGRVWWITISNIHATDAAAVELSDGASTDRWGVTVETSVDLGAPFHVEFDPPIAFDTDIRIDITGGTVSATVAYT